VYLENYQLNVSRSYFMYTFLAINTRFRVLPNLTYLCVYVSQPCQNEYPSPSLVLSLHRIDKNRSDGPLLERIIMRKLSLSVMSGASLYFHFVSRIVPIKRLKFRSNFNLRHKVATSIVVICKSDVFSFNRIISSWIVI